MPTIDWSTIEIPPAAQQWAQMILMWIGFGTLVGLLAKAIMPGRDPGGTIVTLLLGIVGTVIGCGTLALVRQGQQISPISLLGFAVGTGGALVLLIFYRLLAGRLHVDRGGHAAPLTGHAGRPHGRNRKPSTIVINHD